MVIVNMKYLESGCLHIKTAYRNYVKNIKGELRQMIQKKVQFYYLI